MPSKPNAEWEPPIPGRKKGITVLSAMYRSLTIVKKEERSLSRSKKMMAAGAWQQAKPLIPVKKGYKSTNSSSYRWVILLPDESTYHANKYDLWVEE